VRGCILSRLNMFFRAANAMHREGGFFIEVHIMGKAELKQGYDNPALLDVDRAIPKAEGGEYTEDNFRVITPTEHMERHGTLRVRSASLETLKAAIDTREQYLKMRNKISNQLLAFERSTDTPHDADIEQLKSILESAELLEKNAMKAVVAAVKVVAKEDPFIAAVMSIKGVAEGTVAYLATYIDLEKAPHASSLWAYVGYDKPSHSRYTKNVAGGGNKRLRTALYRMADSMMKTRGAYRDVYDRRKLKTSNSQKIVKSRNTKGQLVEVAWKDAKPSHRHGDAMRVMIKHFLRDYWLVGREMAGLPTSEPYVQEQLGHTHITTPQEHGWPVIAVK